MALLINLAVLVPVGAVVMRNDRYTFQNTSSLFETFFSSAYGRFHTTLEATLAGTLGPSKKGTYFAQDIGNSSAVGDHYHGAQHQLIHQIHEVLMFYPAALLVMAAVVTCLYHKKGYRVVFKIIVYLISLSTMKLTVKLVFEEHQYRYPKSMTTMHLLVSAVFGFIILGCRAKAVAIPNRWELSWGILPIASAFAVTLALNNMALTLCSASFTEIIGATSPIVTIGFVLVMGMPFHMPLVIPTCLVAFGCMMSAGGEVNFSLLGSLFCFGANITRSLRTSLQQRLMTGDTKHKFDPADVLAWTCGASFLIMLLWSLLTEGLEPWTVLLKAEGYGLSVALFGSCINACILNFAVLFVTKDLGAVGTQIIAQMKSIATVLGGVVLFHESLSYNEVAGFILCLVGTGWFSHMQANTTKSDSAVQHVVDPKTESERFGTLEEAVTCNGQLSSKCAENCPPPAG